MTTFFKQRPDTNGMNMDIFNASAPPLHLFPQPPPKYEDAFPHERPGQIEEMLRESDDEDLSENSEDGESPGEEALKHDRIRMQGLTENTEPSQLNGRCGTANGSIATASSRVSTAGRRNVYLCD